MRLEATFILALSISFTRMEKGMGAIDGRGRTEPPYLLSNTADSSWPYSVQVEIIGRYWSFPRPSGRVLHKAEDFKLLPLTREPRSAARGLAS